MLPLLKAYYILGTILVAGDVIVNKTNKVPCPDEANCLVGKKTTKINCIKCGALIGGLSQSLWQLHEVLLSPPFCRLGNLS